MCSAGLDIFDAVSRAVDGIYSGHTAMVRRYLLCLRAFEISGLQADSQALATFMPLANLAMQNFERFHFIAKQMLVRFGAIEDDTVRRMSR